MLHTTNDKRPITGFLLNYMINPKPGETLWIEENRLNTLWERAGTAPMMDFVIGHRWNSMVLEKRKKINKAIVQHLDNKYRFYNEMTYLNTCKMEVERERKSETKLQVFLSTKLKSRANETIELVYIMEKSPPYFWQIKELKINGMPVKAALKNQINFLIATEGVDKTAEYLEKTAFGEELKTLDKN
jgi:ABC-type transporter MlaC component